jgi:hypothetical protein
MHVPMLRQTDACCHGAAVFYKRNRWAGAALMVRSAPSRVSNHEMVGTSFETPRKGAAPQDEGQRQDFTAYG